MTTKINLSTERMKTSEIPKYLKDHNAHLANWDECVNDKEFLKENKKELEDGYIWVDSKNLKKIDTKELYVTDLALKQSKKGMPLALGVFYYYRGRLGLYGYLDDDVARVVVGKLSKK